MENEYYQEDSVTTQEWIDVIKRDQEETEEQFHQFAFKSRSFEFHLGPQHLVKPGVCFIQVKYEINGELNFFRYLPYEYIVCPSMVQNIKWTDQLNNQILSACKSNHLNDINGK